MDNKNDLEKAAAIVNAGGIIIFPTDTAFGIGCRIDSESAINRLFKLRLRPETQAVPVLVDSPSMAEKYWSSPLPDNVRHIIKDYWPGSVTVIYDCREYLISPLVRGGGKTLGMRMPDHQIILQIIKKAGVPVLGPSANFHGDKTPYSLSDLNPELVSQMDFVVSGECKLKTASTVIDTTVFPWKILRQGKVIIDINKYFIK